MRKKLNVGIIGYGFMGRTHSNAYRRVVNFFDVPYEPVLQVICGLEADKAKAFADQWGYKSHTTDWHKVIEDKTIDVVDICVPNNVHAEIAIAAAKAGKAIVCEKPLALNGAGQGDGRCSRKGGRCEPRIFQLSAGSGGNPGQAAYRRGSAGADIPLSGEFPAGLDDIGEGAAGRDGDMAAGCQNSRLGSNGRPAGSLHRHSNVAQWADYHPLRDDRDICEGADER